MTRLPAHGQSPRARTPRPVHLAVALTVGAALAACGDDDPARPVPPWPATAIGLLPGSPRLTVGDTLRLEARAVDARGRVVAIGTLTWSSRDASVASVNAAGLVTAVSPGETWVRATTSTLSDSARITVEGAPPLPGIVTQLELDAPTLTLEEGDARTLAVTARNGAGQVLTGLAVSWRSSDPDIATVDGSGRVVALRPGTVNVVARVQAIETTSVVEVSASYGYDLILGRRQTGSGHVLQRIDLRTASAAPLALLETIYAPQGVPSPDGLRIAYVCMGALGDPAICVADRNGGGTRFVANWFAHALLAPTWSPDGLYLAFEDRGGHGRTVSSSRISIVRADGQGFTTLTLDLPGDQYAPAWSPVLEDGSTRLAFAHDSAGLGAAMQIWTMRPDGSDRRPLTLRTDVVDTEAAWSPDGRTIAFRRSPLIERGSLWLVDVASRIERPLFGGTPGLQRSPNWSPDGRLVAFVSAHATPVGSGPTWDVFTIWADGTRVARRTTGGGVTFPAFQRRLP